MVATYALLFILLSFPLVLLIGRQAYQAGLDSVDSSSSSEASAIAVAVEFELNTAGRTDTEDLLLDLSQSTGYIVVVTDALGNVLLSSTPVESDNPSVGLQFSRADLPGTDGTIQNDRGESFEAVPIDAPGTGYVLVGPVSPQPDQPWGAIWQDIALGLLIAAGLVGLLSWLIAGRIAEPLESLAEQARLIDSHGFVLTSEPSAPREIRELAASFNTIGAQVDQLVAESDHERLLLETIFDNLSDGVIVVGEVEDVVLANRKALETLNVAGRSAEGLPLVVAFRNHDLVTHFRESMARGVMGDQPIQFTRHNRQLDATVIPVSESDQQLGIIVIRDVTDLRRLETIRREFVANVSHELRTPLASIRALADTLEEGAIEDRDVAYDFAQRIIDESDRLARLVEELLDLAALESGRVVVETSATDPKELLELASGRFRDQVEQAGIRLVIEPTESLPKVEVDRLRIEQVLLNLVHNSTKFTPAGGTITLSAVADGNLVKFSVSDTGAGIPEEEWPRVFERFYKGDRSRTTGGTGLGLAISKHIVQAHAGRIWVETGSAGGATISFTVPATP